MSTESSGRMHVSGYRPTYYDQLQVGPRPRSGPPSLHSMTVTLTFAIGGGGNSGILADRPIAVWLNELEPALDGYEGFLANDLDRRDFPLTAERHDIERRELSTRPTIPIPRPSTVRGLQPDRQATVSDTCPRVHHPVS